MLERKLNRKNNKAFVVAMSVCSILLFTACAKRAGSGSGVTAQGTINLDAVKAGMPESTFTEAKITFAPDLRPAASSNGKTQYLSRSSTAKKGQYVVECKDGFCFWLEVKYPEKEPITKEEALETLKQLLPIDAPPQTKVDDSLLSKSPPQEIYEYADKYTGMLEYTDKTGAKVASVSAFSLPADQVRKGLSDMGKAPTKSGSAPSTETPKKARKATKAKKESAAEPTATEAPATTTTTETTTTTTP
jgi:hypothetical protein